MWTSIIFLISLNHNTFGLSGTNTNILLVDILWLVPVFGILSIFNNMDERELGK